MSSWALLSFVLFSSGLAALLSWLAFLVGNPRAAVLLRKSVLFFLLPGALMVPIPMVIPVRSFGVVQFLAFMLVLVIIEELLKMAAARSEERPADKFALVMLFGIGELMLAKPIGPLLAGEMMGTWSRWGLFGVGSGGLLALLMHSVTGAIYAFRLPHGPWLALLVCTAVHFFYNVVVSAFLSLTIGAVLAIALGMALLIMLPEPGQGRVQGDA